MPVAVNLVNDFVYFKNMPMQLGPLAHSLFYSSAALSVCLLNMAFKLAAA